MSKLDIWEAPYKNGKPSKAHKETNKQGVYFIRNKSTKEILYIGMSGSNCYKALYRHFHYWNDKIQRVTYSPQDSNIEIRICICKTATLAANLERRLIKDLLPKENHEFYTDFIPAELPAPF
jgi:excinuclease UvrABC nuclease subunit